MIHDASILNNKRVYSAYVVPTYRVFCCMGMPSLSVYLQYRGGFILICLFALPMQSCLLFLMCSEKEIRSPVHLRLTWLAAVIIRLVQSYARRGYPNPTSEW